MTEPVGVVIVSWNVRALLARCLESLAAQRNPDGSQLPTRVVVVDNASEDGTVEALAAAFPEVIWIANAENAGFTRANNQGFAALGIAGIPGRREAVEPAQSKAAPLLPPAYTLILNPDTEMAPEALAEMLAELERHPEAGALGPALFYPDGSPQPSRRRFPSLLTALVESTPIAWHWPNLPAIRRYHMLEAKAPIDADDADGSTETDGAIDADSADSRADGAITARTPGTEAPLPPAGPVDWVTGAAILFRSQALEAADGFDEGFFMYSEELDLCRRLRDLGWTTRYTPRARVVHHEGKSSEQVVPRRHRMFQRSRLRYFRKHHGRAAATLLRVGILGQYALELALEASKLLLGHRPELRRARIAAYWSLLRDGLVESPREGRPT